MEATVFNLKTLRIILLTIFVIFSVAKAREIKDMTGRKVVLPDKITKVISVSPPGTYLLYAIDPYVVAGLNFPFTEEEKKYLLPRFYNLPVIGGFFGQGRTLNVEEVLKIKPDFILIWAWNWKDSALQEKIEKSLKPLGIPWVNVKLDRLEDYPDAILFLGDILNKKDRSKKLYQYAINTFKEVKSVVDKIPPEKRIRVYYAEGPDGLQTEREKSVHAELIPMAGGINVHKGDPLDHYGKEQVSMEQVLMYNPDVILVEDRRFYEKIFLDHRWRNIKAVREKRVYLIPRLPFNWFDRPPSFMRILGLKWLTNILYPDYYKIDIIKETKEFYKLFLQVNITDKEAKEILNK